MKNNKNILTNIEKKALCIVLAAGWESAKKLDNPSYNIFMDRKDWNKLDYTYTNLLEKLGLDEFWDNKQKYIKKGKED
jgi:hypothetical protein